MYYDHIYSYHNGFALTEINGKYGIINRRFEEIIPPVLESINSYDLSGYFYDGLLYGILNDSLILFDTLGNKKRSYKEKDIYPPLFWNRNYTIDSLNISGSEGRRGCKLPDGKLIIPFEYSSIYEGLGNHIIATKRENESYENGSHYSTVIYDRNGNEIRKDEGKIICWKQADLYFIQSNDDYILKDTQFITKRSEKYKNFIVVDSLCWVKTSKGWGLINNNFEYLIKPRFDGVYVNSFWTAVNLNEKYGFFSRDGKQLTELKYNGDFSQYIGNDSLIVAYQNDHVIILDSKGKCIYNCNEPSNQTSYYPNGQKMLEGSYSNYWKIGTWKYYRDDSINSLQKTIEYFKSEIIIKEYDKNGNIKEIWSEERKISN